MTTVLLTGAAGNVPVDNYGCQKLTAERWLQSSGLRQCSLRLGGVMDMSDLLPKHWSYRPFMFMVPLDQPEHGVDVRDVARAYAAWSARLPSDVDAVAVRGEGRDFIRADAPSRPRSCVWSPGPSVFGA